MLATCLLVLIIRYAYIYCCLQQEFWVDGARVFDMDAFSDIMLLSRRLYGIDGGCVLSKVRFVPFNTCLKGYMFR